MLELARIQSILTETCHLDPAAPIIAGVSGGADSVCLLDVLIKLGWNVKVAHFDHHIRSESSDDAQHVRVLTRHYGVPFLYGEAKPGSLMNISGVSAEAVAREARYRFLFNQARAQAAQAVLVAHTADDQVETVLLHLLRGSGLNGLCAMGYQKVVAEWDTNIPLIRPLLDIWRDQVEEYCRINHLLFIQDQTNQDTAYLRNRIRCELIPMMEQINPQFKTGLQRLTMLTRDDVEELDRMCETQWLKVRHQSGSGWIALHLSQMRQISPALQRRIIRKAWLNLKGMMEDVEFETTERARSLLDKSTGSKRVQLSHGLWAKIEGKYLILCEEGARLPLDEAYPSIQKGQGIEIPVPGQVDLGNQWMITTEMLDNAPEKNWISTNSFEAFLDAGRIQHSLRMQTGQQGARFAPLGMEGKTQKLSDIFINQKIPARMRETLPLLLDGEQIAWIPGYRSADFCRITPITKNVIHLKLYRMNMDEK